MNRSFLPKAPTAYPDPGSNRDGFPHWCLRPARLPIPPSGLKRVQRYAKKLNNKQIIMNYFKKD